MRAALLGSLLTDAAFNAWACTDHVVPFVCVFSCCVVPCQRSRCTQTCLKASILGSLLQASAVSSYIC